MFNVSFYGVLVTESCNCNPATCLSLIV